MTGPDPCCAPPRRPIGWAGLCFWGPIVLWSLIFLAHWPGGGPAKASSAQTASLSPGAATTPPAPVLPRPLDAKDAELYRQIFAIQKKGDWRAADRLIVELGDRLLMGHVLAQRYLHPTHYRSRFAELAAWMKEYADHPQAGRIHALALRRKPAGARTPPSPRTAFPKSLRDAVSREYSRPAEPPAADFETADVPGDVWIDEWDTPPRQALSRVREPAERRLRRTVARLVLKEHLSAAEDRIASAARKGKLRPAALDRVRTQVAVGWFRWGDSERAYAIASEAARRSKLAAPDAHFWAGLAAFHMGRTGDAQAHFENLARMPGLSDEDRARAAFWAARTHLVAGNFGQVGLWLDRAGQARQDFYGIMARHIRGQSISGDEAAIGAPGPSDSADALISAPPMQRALALVQAGQHMRAEQEFRVVPTHGTPSFLRAVITMAEAGNMPASALRAARALQRATGERHAAGLYPLPGWAPEGGFEIDRALIFALARQESAFNPRAVSHRGARGLMQLMPATANYISRRNANQNDVFRGISRTKLHDPALNLALGQKYVGYLLSHGVVSGDLVLMIAAYNGGPGNVAKWLREIRPKDDALIFIESIPLGETRHFVKTILANFWTYRYRLNQDSPSLTALAGGDWPHYVSLDRAGFGVAEEVGTSGE